MFNEMRLFGNRELSLQGPEHTTEHLSIFFIGGIIARKMDINTPTGQLCIHASERSHLVGADQNMAHPSGILEMFEVI